VLNQDGFGPTTENGIPLFHPIQCIVQFSHNGVGFIRRNDEFEIDLLVERSNTSTGILCHHAMLHI
jgi:hypothetical protein